MIQEFIDHWQNRGNEKSDTQSFWNGILREFLNIDKPENFIDYEKDVKLAHVSYIDAYIPSTGIIIEQKSRDVNLDLPAKQSDGTLATPFEQAKRYYDWLPLSQRGRFIIVSNFREIRIHDMESPKAKPKIILLDELEPHKLAFLVNTAVTPPDNIEVKISLQAGELVGKLHDALLKRYIDPDDKASQRSLNIFCVRVVFLLYAEDSGLFAKSQFHDYLKPRELVARDALRKLFSVLNQKIEERDPYLEAGLKAFPYVNGGLFAENDIELPQLDGEPLRIILEDMSESFDWSGISPTIFGAVFESTLNPDTRHDGGMHYTAIENIHKVIDPLFMDELNSEFEAIIQEEHGVDLITGSVSSTQRKSYRKTGRAKKDDAFTKKLRAFQKKLASLTFFDPACGSGNFLTETYLSLRRLENKILRELSKQISFTDSQAETPIQVSISQFFGIEINDFAVAVARTALWIAEAQMWNETKSIVHFFGELLPLKTFDNIHEANALLTDWHDIVKPSAKLFIMGNPPFLGYSIQTKAQRQDISKIFRDENGKTYRASGKIDYVACWYFKASEFIYNTQTRAAFVSTNSITQGEQVSAIFKPLKERFDIHIDFAYTTFIWDSEAQDKASVQVVVIGFNAITEEKTSKPKRLYTDEGLMLVENINFYLVPAPDDFAEPTTKPLSKDAPEIFTGNMPADGGNLIIEAEEYDEFIKREPRAKKFIKRYMMGYEFINGITRYCLWLVNATPQDIHDMPLIRERVKKCRELRMKGSQPKLANTPHLFREKRNPERYLAIPKTSSEKRFYIPIAWLDGSVIPGDGLLIIPDAALYHFGILTSRVHMAWMRRVCGRLKMDYRYSKKIVYNTFIWPSPSEAVRVKIERCAQGILDARAANPECNFAALYDDVSMPAELRSAHEANDKAVCEAYGWPEDLSEFEIVARLFVMYNEVKNKV